MQTQWRGHTLKVTGNWVARYLFLAPQYELWLDDTRLDVGGGPRVRPTLEAIIEADAIQQSEPAQDADQTADQTSTFHVKAEVLSLVGMRPTCELSINGELLHTDRVRVENLINPFLILFIAGATAWMLYVGPGLLRTYLGM